MTPGIARRPWCLAWLAFLPVAAIRAGNLAESDTFWQVRTGIDILAGQELPTVDSYSWTAAGDPWTLNSWGFDVILGAAYQLGGLALVALVGAALVMVIVGLALVLARRLGAHPGIAAATLLLVSPLLIGWLSVRPQLIDYAAALLLVLLLQEVSDSEHWRRAVLAVGVLMAVWVNLHAAVLLGLGVVAVFAVLLLLDTSRASVRCRGIVALAASAVGSLVNPYGVGVFAQAAQVQAASARVVREWSGVDWTSPVQVVALLLGGVAMAASARRRDASLVAALGVCLLGAVLVLRMQPVLIVVAAPAIAGLASSPKALAYVTSRKAVLYPGAALGLLVLAAMAVPSLTHVGRPDQQIFPAAIHERIPTGCRVFNSYLMGGYLILVRPDVAVSIDSRNDVYGPDRVAAAQRALAGEAHLQSDLARAKCVLVPPTSGLAVQLQSDSEWRVLATEPAAVLFVRR